MTRSGMSQTSISLVIMAVLLLVLFALMVIIFPEAMKNIGCGLFDGLMGIIGSIVPGWLPFQFTCPDFLKAIALTP